MLALWLATLATLALAPSTCNGKAVSRQAEEGQKLVVVLLDGFRFDYADRMDPAEVPAFTWLKEHGVAAEYVQSVTPSMSFPSWTSIVTGLYSESHGIVGNDMFDPATGEAFHLSLVGRPGDNTNNSLWWGQHVPLWATATAAVDDELVLPEKCTAYNNVDPYTAEHLELLLDETVADLSDGFRLSVVYNSLIDEVGHRRGPDSDEVREAVVALDAVIMRFLQQLEETGLAQTTNVIIITDHGMSADNTKTKESIFDYISRSDIARRISLGPFTNLLMAEGVDVDDVVEALQQWPGVQSYRRENIPEHFHFRDNPLVLDAFVVSNGDVLIDIKDVGFAGNGGSHGFDDTSPLAGAYEEGPAPDMRGIFYAVGPAFKSAYAQPWIKLVDEYQVFLHVLNITGQEHNGTWSRVQQMFADL